MKNNLFIATAIALTGASAFASTARINALGDSVHVVDVQTVFSRPSDMHALPEALEIEFGAGSTVGSPAEGGFLKNVGEGKLGFFLGHGDTIRTAGTGNAFLGVENPFAVSYGMKAGDMPWGVSFGYSASDKKTTEEKQTNMSLTGSAVFGDLTVNAMFGLGDTATGTHDTTTFASTDTDAKYTGTGMGVGAIYAMGEWSVYGQFKSSTTKVENTAASDSNEADTDMKVGFVNVAKKEGAEFFYGAAYQIMNNNNKTTSVKTDTTMMPVVIGIEADAASWLTLRGSITQNVLLGGQKTTKMDTISHNTVVAAGAGLKFNKTVLDMTLSMKDNGKVDATDIGGKAALTYLF